MLSSSLQATRRRRPSTLAIRHLGAAGLFGLAILDSTPLPTFGGPDILIVILVVARHTPWWECVLAATAGSMIGAYFTFRLARRAGRAYIESKFGQRRVPKLLAVFDKWGTSALVASAAVPFPFPTSLFFAAAGASNRYTTQKYLTVVGLSRAARYFTVAMVGDLYGRHVIRVLTHPVQYWGWFAVLLGIIVALVAGGVLVNRRLATNPSS
jgi:membrane protein YqaA with SNARE-associated domain